MNQKISVPIFVESRYKVNRRKIKEAVSQVFRDEKFTRDVEVSIAVVGDRKMRSLNNKYRNQDKTTNVLSFSQLEGESSVFKEDQLVMLGDVVISYPQIIKDASEQEKLVDFRINELVTHGVRHLLGIHH